MCKHRGLFSVHSRRLMYALVLHMLPRGDFFIICTRVRERDEQRWPYFKAIQWPVVKCSTVVWCIHLSLLTQKKTRPNAADRKTSRMHNRHLWCSLWIFRLKFSFLASRALCLRVCAFEHIYIITKQEAWGFFSSSTHVSQHFWLFFILIYTIRESARRC